MGYGLQTPNLSLLESVGDARVFRDVAHTEETDCQQLSRGCPFGRKSEGQNALALLSPTLARCFSLLTVWRMSTPNARQATAQLGSLKVRWAIVPVVRAGALVGQENSMSRVRIRTHLKGHLHGPATHTMLFSISSLRLGCFSSLMHS